MRTNGDVDAPSAATSYASEPQRRVWDFCYSLSDLSELRRTFEFSESDRLALNTDGQKDPKPRKLPPRCRHARSCRILSWNSAPQPPLFLLSSCFTCLSNLSDISRFFLESTGFFPGKHLIQFLVLKMEDFQNFVRSRF